MRALVLCLVTAVALALWVVGRGQSSRGAVYSIHDLQGIVDPRPVLAGWSQWEEADSYISPTPARAPAFTLHEWLGESPSSAQRALAEKLRKAGFLIGRHKVWGGRNTKPRYGEPADAVLYAFLFRDAAGARTGFRAFPRPPAKGLLTAKELGAESWGYHAASGRAGEAAVYLWHRGNLLVLAEIVCDTDCGFPVIPPAHAYADTIDARAKRLS